MSTSLSFSSIRSRNSIGSTSSSPRAFRISLYAARRKYAFDTPGISTGYWNARKIPCCARTSGSSVEQVLPSYVTVPLGDLVRRMTREHLRERALAGPVRSHDGVHLARVHGEVDPAEDLLSPTVAWRFFISSMNSIIVNERELTDDWS